MPGFLRRPRFWLTLLILLSVSSAGAYFFTQAKAQRTAKAAAQKNAKAPESPYAAIAQGKADVEGGIIQIAARRGGVVEAVLVQEGDTVRRGQVLARQEDDELRLAVSRSEAEVAQARAQIATAQVALNSAQREYDRLQSLASKNIIAGQRLDAARDKIMEARAQIEAQQAGVQTALARLNEARFELEKTIIRAPEDGRIVRRYANPGSGASTLNVSNMFDLEPNTARIVRAEISEADVPDVAQGQEVEIVPEADGAKIYTGRVLRRAALFGARKLQSDDPSERTDARVVEVVVTADGAPLLIGQRVFVKFMKPGQQAGVKRAPPKAPESEKEAA
ncbi:MAG: HlyD family efflux transporter periplasmic adaptor subunit [Proteobacteria bacterium]|nr:HlyD family efflux transporter periplasmic adaptor subunit [Pseudomonadota bacterium]MBW3617673.1 HlyD family efflux transporter periplasmic adaptor subunit [Pseudomonadota bacterium]